MFLRGRGIYYKEIKMILGENVGSLKLSKKSTRMQGQPIRDLRHPEMRG